MEFLRPALPHSRWRRLWHSERLAPLRFYGHYLRWPLLLVLLALAGEKLIFYGALPLAGCVRREWDYAQAGRAYAAGHDDAALAAIRRALLETRGDARLWRLAARISTRLDSPEAAYCWEQADRLEPGSTDTELALAEAALALNQAELAGTALREVTPTDQADTRYAIDAGRLAQTEGNPARARYWFEQAEAGRPGTAPALFALADWHGGLAMTPDQARAREIYLELARRPDECVAAWRALDALDLRRHDFAAARIDGNALFATPGATFADRVAQLDAADSRATADAALAVLLRTPRPADAALVLDWMTAHARTETALIWIRHQNESWQDDAAIGAARARCLAALGDWETLRDDQRDSVWPGHESERLMLLARASLELGNEGDARAAWQQAIAACAQPGDFAQLAHAADSFRGPDGWSEEKAEVWTALANRFPGQEWPLRALLAYQLGRGDLAAAQSVAAQMAALTPDDPSPRANFDLIRLLRGDGADQAAADLQELVRAAPENPDVVTATAYSLYRAGRFDDALATLGALDQTVLNAPERAAYLGQLLAAAGPIDRAKKALELARVQPGLLDAQRDGIARSLDLLAYRRAMADLLHGRDAATRGQARDFFISRASSGMTVFLIGKSVALATNPARAADALARLKPDELNQAELTLYEGAVLNLTGKAREAVPLLELTAGLPVETPAAKWRRAIEAWWTLVDRAPFDASRTAGLLTAYRGLEKQELLPAFWQRDKVREMKLTRAALNHGALADAVQERLEALARHVSVTPEMEAEIGYALFLQGRIESGRERLEVLSPAELARPEPALDYAAILRACGETKRADQYTIMAGRELAGEKSP
jgi:DNA-binding SARP family transcriptional activator